MAQRRRKRKYKRKTAKVWNLGAIPKEDKEIYKELGFSALSFAAGQTLGAAAGKFSGYLGTVITGIGFWKKNLFATSFGTGMVLSEANGPAGFTIESMKERSTGFLKTIGSKFMNPMAATESGSSTQTSTTTNGIDGLEGPETPKYFLNPYSQNEEYSQAIRTLENIETEVREVSGIGEEEEVGDVGELEDERNY